MKKLLKFLADCEAAEIAELAVVLPILFTMIFGVFSFGRAYNIYSTITRAAQDGARFAVAPKSATDPASFSCGGTASRFPCPSDIADKVNETILASHLDPTQVSRVVPSSTASCPDPAPAPLCTTQNLGSTSGEIYVCQNVLLNVATTTPALQACGTIVSFHYSYKFLPVPFIQLNAIEIPARAQVRMEF